MDWLDLLGGVTPKTPTSAAGAASQAPNPDLDALMKLFGQQGQPQMQEQPADPTGPAMPQPQMAGGAAGVPEPLLAALVGLLMQSLAGNNRGPEKEPEHDRTKKENRFQELVGKK